MRRSSAARSRAKGAKAALRDSGSTTQALRQQNLAAMHAAVDAARRLALPSLPLQTAATDLLQALVAAIQVGALYDTRA